MTYFSRIRNVLNSTVETPKLTIWCFDIRIEGNSNADQIMQLTKEKENCGRVVSKFLWALVVIV